MAILGIGDSMVMMQGFGRQKAVARNPAKKARSLSFRRYVVPSETRESLGARIALAEAGISARGKSFEEVIATVMQNCSGKDYGGARKAQALKQAGYRVADANLSRMRSKIGGAQSYKGLAI
jgi:hypothetical protein